MKLKEVILIAAILVIGILGMLVTRTMNYEDGGKTAVIYIDNQEVKRIPVSVVEEEKTFSFEFGGNTGYLSVKEGAVRMEEMSLEVCPEKVCSDTGWISKPYEMIVCLPNRIIVNFESRKDVNNDGSLVDGIAF